MDFSLEIVNITFVITCHSVSDISFAKMFGDKGERVI